MQNINIKLHPTKLIVSKESLLSNIAVYKNILPATTKLMLMIKAFGYGSGDVSIAKILARNNAVDYLGVAYVNEGIALREEGITLPIMVMNSGMVDLNDILAFNLEPTIYCPEQLTGLIKLNPQKITGLKAHIKIDSGMHRLGFHHHELAAAASAIKKNKIQVVGAYTHLASTPEPGHDDFTHQQVAYFNKACDLLSDALGYQPLRHVLNSAGIIRFPEYHYDMVRAGMGVYGIDPSGTMPEKFKPISRFVTEISQINELQKGETVGYVRQGKITRNHSRIAVLPVGYADGYNRLFSNGRAQVWVNGHRAPVIGNVCMDMAFADVTGIDCQVGDEVELFGDHISIQELAEAAHTIDYEILTSIGARVVREYV